MHLRYFIFTISLVTALNEETKSGELSERYDPLQIQYPQTVQEGPNNVMCPNNEILLQTLNIINENLLQGENEVISPEKLKHVLDTTVQYLVTAKAIDETDVTKHAQELKNVVANLNRSKKEVLRSPQLLQEPEKYIGKITLQYDLPSAGDQNCQVLFQAIVNAINTAFLQMSKFCEDSGKCSIQGSNLQIPSTQLISQSKNLPYSDQLLHQSNVIDFLVSHPQNGDLITLLQNYRPNAANLMKHNDISNSEKIKLPPNYPINSDRILPQNNFINTEKQIMWKHLLNGGNTLYKYPNVINPGYKIVLNSGQPSYQILGNNLPEKSTAFVQNNLPYLINNVQTESVKNLNHGEMWGDLPKDKGHVIEMLSIHNRPTGYVSHHPTLDQNNHILNSPSIPGASVGKALHNSLSSDVPSSNDKSNNFTELGSHIPEETHNLRINANVPGFPNFGENGISLSRIPSFENTNMVYRNAPLTQNYVSNQPLNLQSAQGVTGQLQSKQYFLPSFPYYNNIPKTPQLNPYNPLFSLQDYNKYGNQRNLPYQNKWQQIQKVSPQISYPTPSPNYNAFGLPQFPQNQGNPYINAPFPYPILDQKFPAHKINNSIDLNDLYRLNSASNGAQLNMAPNKNGVVELTFTLKRPQSVVYNPLYYVKYRLPYQTYMYNVQNILQRRPFLRNNPGKLYQELLAVANITESSQDLKDLAKEEIANLVASHGALVKAKVLHEDSTESNIDDEIKNMLRVGNLSPEDTLNATKKVVNYIEEINNTTFPLAGDETTANDTIIPVKAVYTRSIRYPYYPSITNTNLGLTNIVKNNLGFNPYYYRNRQMILPQRVIG